MTKRFVLMLIASGVSVTTTAKPVPSAPGVEWVTTTPEAVGWAPDLVDQAHRYANAIGTASFMVVQHNIVVASWGPIDQRFEIYSMRKSLLSALIGIAVAGGRIRLDSTLAQLRIDDTAPSLTDLEQQATVRDLLGSRSGVYHPALYETASQGLLRPPRGSHEHGTFWYYNNWDFNALGMIYEKTTGVSIFQAIQTDLAMPIGMQDYRPSDGHYVDGFEAADRYWTPPESGIRAYPLRMSARDLARFGLLYLRGGQWDGRQVVPAAWVADSTKPRSETRSHLGYGYLWWTGRPPNGIAPSMDLPSGGYWAEGNRGQFLAVDPADDMVVVHQTGGGISNDQFGHLMWLVLTAAHSSNPGRDPLPAISQSGPGAGYSRQ